MTEATEAEIEMIYIGACTLANGKQGARWISKEAFDECADEKQVDAMDLVKRVSSAYAKDTAKLRSIGTIYRTKGTIENKIVKTAQFGTTMRFVGRCDHPLIQAFEAEDFAAKEVERTRRASTHVKNDPLIMRDMQNAVARIRQLPMRQRVAIVDAIRSELLNRVLAARD